VTSISSSGYATPLTCGATRMSSESAMAHFLETVLPEVDASIHGQTANPPCARVILTQVARRQHEAWHGRRLHAWRGLDGCSDICLLQETPTRMWLIQTGGSAETDSRRLQEKEGRTVDPPGSRSVGSGMFKAGKRVTSKVSGRGGIILASRVMPSLTGQYLVNLVEVSWDDGTVDEVPAESLIVEISDDGPA
jgi:hypothetical protein